ncbi:MAG: hypothetical protein A2847_00180 [Candidatus Sungbacteria bacterium RIFCSPHIGHO2_01_FULL_50_25]|uniref:PPC domain-containing protein n=1 Tax=Candidatus Sungbacteria bacterium RIFCSPHIGHO2_01_FULL_50_25 TaxID=1802265 RepID=A0A1G2KB21_9BACT|nr:MAG: hypothetical protein A2847_00180 [Candidatus Sungbacteria bacterium RIFCSPHIGHO2_01_FULL_50_25]
MKTIAHDEKRYMIRLDAGEELFSSLISFAEDSGIRSASFTAIGTAQEVILSWYNLAKKQYEDTAIADNLEILGITGNLGLLDGKPIIHAHGTFGDRGLSAKGGHIKKLVVLATCEVSLIRSEGAFERKPDEATGLNLLI